MNLSVVVLSYNHPELTARALHSALNLGLADVFLVHNGSDEKNISRLKREFPGINHLEVSPNRGYGYGVNCGIEEAFLKYPWVILLTNDSQLVNLPIIPANPSFMGAKILIKNTAKVDAVGGIFIPREARLFHCKSLQEFENERMKRGQFPYIPGTVFLLHKSIYQAIGGINEKYIIYFDDVDWSMRIRKAGYEISIDDNWLVRHGMSKTGRRNEMYSLYYFQRNRKKVSWKYAAMNEKIFLVFNLIASWTKLLIKLYKTRRNLNLLFKAIID